MLEEITVSDTRRIIAAMLCRASLDYLLGLPGAWKWLSSEDAALFFDVLELNQERELKLLVKKRYALKHKKDKSGLRRTVIEEGKALEKEIQEIYERISYNIRKSK